MSDQGVIVLPEDREIPWAREPISAEELEERRAELQGRSVRVTMTHKEHGQHLLTVYQVPAEWLDCFLQDWVDETEEILSVEPMDDVPLHTTS